MSQEEMKRIEFADLVLLGIPPSEIEAMPDYQKFDILEIAAAQNALKHGKMPG